MVNRGFDSRRLFRRRAIKSIDLKHAGDGSDSSNRFLGEFADAERNGARQLSVKIDRAAAHARNYACVFDLSAMQAHQDDVALGSIHVAQHTQNFHIHRLGLNTLEDRVGNTAHPGVNLAHRNCRLRPRALCGQSCR